MPYGLFWTYLKCLYSLAFNKYWLCSIKKNWYHLVLFCQYTWNNKPLGVSGLAYNTLELSRVAYLIIIKRRTVLVSLSYKHFTGLIILSNTGGINVYAYSEIKYCCVQVNLRLKKIVKPLHVIRVFPPEIHCPIYRLRIKFSFSKNADKIANFLKMHD